MISLPTLAARGIALVAVSGMAVPAMAVPLPAQRPEPRISPAAPVLHHGGWGRHSGGIDGGDVLTGVLVLGGIAALVGIASSSANKRAADRAETAPPPRRDGPAPAQRYDDRGADGASSAPGRGAEDELIDRAVNACADAAGRDGEVERIDDARPERDGFRVEGGLTGGRGFTCTTDRDGRVRAIDSSGARARPQRYDRTAPQGDDFDADQADDSYETARAPVPAEATPG